MYALAFWVPVLILFAVLFFGQVYPFGEECFLRTDLYHQYAPFFSELQHKLREGGSLLYSWDIGLGVNFTALYAYYLASPLNWLIVFWPQGLIIEFMTVMVVIKLGLSSLSMTWYLHDRTGRSGISPALFGMFYGLSGYLAAYYWNIMWLDCILLFPLVVRGLERLLEERKGVLYAFALGLSILSNYYISIMTCMFLVLYFTAWCVLRPAGSFGALFGRFLRFGFYSILAGGLAAVLLLPEIAALSYTASYDVSFPKSVTQYFGVIDMLARHFVGVETEQGLDHWPNIYCGALVLPLLVVYFCTARIRLREKIVYGLLVLFLLMSFSWNLLNFIWHGFHYPNSLPARQSYLYIFLVLFMSFRAFCVMTPEGGKKGKSPETGRLLGMSFLLTAGFILLCQKLITAKHFAFWVYYVTLCFCGIYVLLLWLLQKGGARRKPLLLAALIAVTAELSVNTALTSITTTSRTAYTKDNADVRALKDSLFPSTDFFRIEKIDRKTKNDGAWLNFPSVSLFSSMANADCTAFFKAIGCEASTNAYSITGSTPLVNMLFSVKYAFYDTPQTDGEEKRFLESSGSTYLYENRLSLPLGFVMPEEMSQNWLQDLDNPALVQDALCDVLGTSAVLVPNESLPSESGADYAVTISQSGEYYAFVTNPKVKKVSVEWPDTDKTFENVDRGYLLELGSLKAGDVISMRSLTEGQDMEAQLYRFDYSALREVYDRLSVSPLKLSVWTDDELSGTVFVDGTRLSGSSSTDRGRETFRLFLSIPYDAGWQVEIDGKPVKTEKAFGTFLSVPIFETGEEQEIHLTYMPKGLKEGAVLSGGSLLILLLCLLLGRKKEQKETRTGRKEGAEAGKTEREEPEARYFLKAQPSFEEASSEDQKEKDHLHFDGKEYMCPDKGETPAETRKKQPDPEEPDPLSRELREAFAKKKSEQAILDRLNSMKDMEG